MQMDGTRFAHRPAGMDAHRGLCLFTPAQLSQVQATTARARDLWPYAVVPDKRPIKGTAACAVWDRRTP
jgi:hypothetical protein